MALRLVSNRWAAAAQKLLAASCSQSQARMQRRLLSVDSVARRYNRTVERLRQLGQVRSAARGISSTGGSSSSTYVIDPAARSVRLHWQQGAGSSVFPIAWLRDNCQCELCFHPTTLSRLQLMENFNPRVSVSNVKMDDAAGVCRITWSDNHVSEYKYDWLRKRSFDEEAQRERRTWYSGKHLLWGSEHSISRHSFTEVQQSDKALLQLLNDMEAYGLCILEAAPGRNSVLDFCNRVAYPLQNNYGDTFEVKSKLNPSNLAYTPARLGLHVDLPYYRELPGIQLLHCIAQSDGIAGGENFFSDGFHAANLLKSTDPEAFRILTTTPVDFYDYGTDFLKDFHLLYRQKVITVNNDGEYEMVCYNNQVRDTYLNIPLQQVQGFYDSLKKYDTILHGSGCAVFTKLKEGEIVCFDNRRVLHGRNKYTVTTASADRHLQGAYLRWDEVYSRIRRLEETVRGRRC